MTLDNGTDGQTDRRTDRVRRNMRRPPREEGRIIITRMVLSGAHTFAKAADIEKLLLLNKRQVKCTQCRGISPT